MKVEFRTTFADVVSFLWLHLTRSPAFFVILGGAALFITWDVCRNAAVQHGLIVRVITMFLTGVVVFVALFLLCLTGTILTMTLSRRNKTFMTDNAVELLEDKILTENRYGKSEYRWDIVQRIVRTRRHIVLYLNQSGGIVVPRRAFQKTEEWDAFCCFVVAHSTK